MLYGHMVYEVNDPNNADRPVELWGSARKALKHLGVTDTHELREAAETLTQDRGDVWVGDVLIRTVGVRIR